MPTLLGSLTRVYHCHPVLTVGDWEPESAPPTLIVQMSTLRPEEFHLIVQSSAADGREPQASAWACRLLFKNRPRPITRWDSGLLLLPSFPLRCTPSLGATNTAPLRGPMRLPYQRPRGHTTKKSLPAVDTQDSFGLHSPRKLCWGWPPPLPQRIETLIT